MDSSDKIAVKEFTLLLRKEVSEIPLNFNQATSSYCHVRRYSTYQLGGLLISLIEQSINQKKDIIIPIICKKEQMRMEQRQQKKQQIERFMTGVKKVQREDLWKSKQIALEYELKQQSSTFLTGAEAWISEILAASKKYEQNDIQLIASLFSVEIVFLSLDKKTRQLSYASFCQSKQLTLTIYMLDNTIYSCISNYPNTSTTGDGFPSDVQLKERIEQSGRASEYKRSAQTGNNINTSTPKDSRNINESKKCDNCKKLTEFKYLYKNTCSHIFCSDCLAKHVQLSIKFQYIKCMVCYTQLSIQMAVKFLDNLKVADNRSSSSQSQTLSKSTMITTQEPSRTQNQKCICCSNYVKENEYFKRENCHIYCCECIKKLYLNARSSLVYCTACNNILSKDAIQNFLAKNQAFSMSQTTLARTSSNKKEEQKQQDSKEYIEGSQQKNKLPEKRTEMCDKCMSTNLAASEMFTPSGCTHRLCLNCAKEEKQFFTKFKSPSKYCYHFPSCQGQIKLSQINIFLASQNALSADDQDKITNIKIEKNGNNSSLSSTSSTNNTSKASEIDSKHKHSSDHKSTNGGSSKMGICSLCRNSYKAQDMFYNLQCDDCYCLKCIDSSKDISAGKCLAKHCRKQLDLDALDEFYEKQAQKVAEEQSIATTATSHKVICSACKAEGQVLAAETPEYFKCTTCSKTTCLKHNVLTSKCPCFCDKCGQQRRQEGNFLVCTKCKQSLCSVCNSTDCKCGSCEFCGKEKSGKLCSCLDRICCVCLNEFENIQLNVKQDTLIRKQQNCVHSFCNPCYFKKITHDAKLDCLFCSSK